MPEDSSKSDRDNLYDRVERVLGAAAMKRMRESKILLVGCGGLGVEIAKNVILTGVGTVTIADQSATSYEDLASQFYLSEDDIGKNRAQQSLKQLKELNPSYVKVNIHQGEITEDLIKAHTVLCVTDQSIVGLKELNAMARKHNVKFIASEIRGLCGSLFVDCGKGFTVYDDNGEEPVKNMITNVTNGEEGMVYIHDSKKNSGLGDGDTVRFEGIEGMTELNSTEDNPKLFSVKITGKHTFTIGDTTNFGKFSGSAGYCYQVKQPQKNDYLSLEESLAKPEFIQYDFGKFENPQRLHDLFTTLHEFKKQKGGLPRSYNQEDADFFYGLVQKLDDKMDKEFAEKFAFTARGYINPMATFFGGFAAQEVLKACSGKFTPLKQWFYFDAFEALPDTLTTEADAQPEKSRYDGQIAVFGREFQKKLNQLNVFMIGVGALGCEYLKNFAMIGCGTDKSKVTITDLDSIELSNLSRQFLFRRKHVGKMKSTCGAEVVKDMNKTINIDALQEKVGPDSEKVFNDKFWLGLNVVVNALDNIHARLYVDGRCVYYQKPLLEAGTLGSKCSFQVIVPKLTESYGSSRDPQDGGGIPMCTLKNFPNAIEHTIQWGRDKFEQFFNKNPTEVNNFLTNKDFMADLEENQATKLNTLETVVGDLVQSYPKTFEDCVAWARNKFEDLYNNAIQQLLFTFPLDLVTSNGTPFWGGLKRPPTPLQFSIKEKEHMDFVIAASVLRANVYGIKPHDPTDVSYFQEIADKVKVADFAPKQGVKIAVTEEEAKEEEEGGDMDTDDYDNQCSAYLKQLPKPEEVKIELKPEDFEKDDDTNHHIDFITACSNLRAANYKIPKADRKKTKGIAGKIIPAMITSTALITGLGSLEMYKLIQKKSKLEDYKNSFVNLALPFCVQSDPIAPEKQKYRDVEWSVWDHVMVDLGRDVTMEEFHQYFKEKHNMEITMMSSGSGIIYSFFGDAKKRARRMKMPLSAVVEEVTGKKCDPESSVFIDFEICVNDIDTDEDLDIPSVRYRYHCPCEN